MHVTVVCPSGKFEPGVGLQVTGSDWFSRPVAEAVNETPAPLGLRLHGHVGRHDEVGLSRGRGRRCAGGSR